MSLEVLTVKEAAAALKLTPKSVYHQIADGNLRAYKVGGAVRIKAADLEKLLRPIKVYTPSTREPITPLAEHVELERELASIGGEAE